MLYTLMCAAAPPKSARLVPTARHAVSVHVLNHGDAVPGSRTICLWP
ncbi:MAG: hypothetical protein M0C28_11950 [Candidatus Moduliflexus flocculans]|nr:hypothetical protein [Candidatus Moduliflexus flocculans]